MRSTPLLAPDALGHRLVHSVGDICIPVASSLPSMKYRQPPPGLFDLPTMSELRACWELCRLHGNTGFWVVWIPTAWSLLMAYHAHSEMSIGVPLYRALLYVPLCFGIKSLMMTIDDILDWDVDMEVERTKNRPIPRGSITPQRAWVFFALQVIVGIHFSLKFLSTTSLYVAMATWPMYVIYPDLKRWMDFAPIPLGMVFQVGIFMGWADISLDGSVSWHLLVPAYIGATLWTVAYETVYQHQDKEDDARIGLHSLALRMGTWTIPLCSLCAMSFLALIAYAGFENGHSIPFFASVAIAGTLLMYRLLRTNINSSSDCKRMFLDTPTVGNIILFGLLADVLHHRLSTGIPI